MSSQRRASSTVWLLGVILFAIVAACADGVGTPEQSIYVQEAWRLDRAVSGHRVHVLEHGVACSACHALADGGVGKVAPDRCAVCHQKEAQIQHAGRQSAARLGAGVRADCTSCHAFTVDGTGHAEELTMPGQVASLAAGGSPHGGRAEPPLVHTFGPGDCKRCHAQAQGEIPAVEVHGTQDCLSCHHPHEEQVPQSAPCEGCHKDIKTAHAGAAKTPSEACQTCHEHQHATALDARSTCVDCHTKQEPIVPATALFAGGHSECLGCHRPHAFQAEQAVECRSCHAEQSILGGGRVAEHNRCTSCHAPHDVKAGPERACKRCHAEVHPDHPERAGGCTTCHDAHPRGQHGRDSARACSSCHQFAASDHGSHGGTDCIKCHKPHDFGIQLSSAVICQDCHAQRVQQVSLNQGHRACQGCHRGLPHRPETLLAGCDTCHAKEHSLVLSGHAQCTNCHEPHSGARSADCGSCHKLQHATAPAGHQVCTNCHEPHGGSPGVRACAGCHVPEATSAHGHLGGQGCLNCHRPHGPEGPAQPPPCKSCHELAKLAGLHQIAKHQSCERCHAGHGDQPDLARNGCLSCHTDRKHHFPDAPRCANCHLFTPSH
ncbi:MAG TPA: cytochrome c3 family protein [Polyangiaceae bacterium]|nr:cytochrome c3 family protein [Polyangiaceae bacterium]